jgi:hypothetical protein
MSRRTYCDTCSKEIREEKTYRPQIDVVRESKQLDLCFCCKNKITTFINNINKTLYKGDS